MISSYCWSQTLTAVAAFAAIAVHLPLARAVVDTAWAQDPFFTATDSLDPPAPVFNLADYGAKGDARTDDRAAIQRAIDAQAAAGAGCIYFPPTRTFLVRGTLHLRDNSTLFLAAGSKILSSARVAEIPDLQPDGHRSWGAEHYHRKSVLYGVGVRNIRILGQGVIDGNVHQWDGTMAWNTDSYRERVHLLRFVRCENVVVRGIKLMNPVFWTQVYSESRNVLIDGIEVDSWQEQKNGDGIDIDSCQNVIVRGARVRSNDDAICLKTMSTAPLRNVLVEGCHVVGSNANGLKIGTETHGPVERVAFRNCRIENTHGAICLYTVDGGSMSDVLVENIDIMLAHSALTIRLGARNRTYAGGPQRFPIATLRNITIRSVTARRITSEHEAYIAGLPHRPIEGVVLENIRIESEATGSADGRSRRPELRETAYPNPNTFGELPAWGLWVRDVRGLRLRRLDLACADNEGRHALVLERVTGASVEHVIVDRVPSPVAVLRDSPLTLVETPAGPRVRFDGTQ